MRQRTFGLSVCPAASINFAQLDQIGFQRVHNRGYVSVSEGLSDGPRLRLSLDLDNQVKLLQNLWVNLSRRQEPHEQVVIGFSQPNRQRKFGKENPENRIEKLVGSLDVCGPGVRLTERPQRSGYFGDSFAHGLPASTAHCQAEQ